MNRWVEVIIDKNILQLQLKPELRKAIEGLARLMQMHQKMQDELRTIRGINEVGIASRVS